MRKHPRPGGAATTSTRLERRRRVNDRAQDWNPGGVAGGARGAAEGGEGAHPPERRAQPQAAGAPLGAGRKGLQLRDRAGDQVPRRALRRRLAAARLPLHVRAPYTAGCPVCSSIADTLAPQVIHLKARDTTLLLASRAALEQLLAYRERMGWGIDWVSSGGSDFNRDLGFVHTEEELKPFLEGEIPPVVEQMAEATGTDVAGYVSEGPGLSAYALSDGTVYRTYVTTARGLEPAMAYYGLLDRAPMGRHEEGEESFWLRRHDEY